MLKWSQEAVKLTYFLGLWTSLIWNHIFDKWHCANYLMRYCNVIHWQRKWQLVCFNWQKFFVQKTYLMSSWCPSLNTPTLSLEAQDVWETLHMTNAEWSTLKHFMRWLYEVHNILFSVLLRRICISVVSIINDNNDNNDPKLYFVQCVHHRKPASRKHLFKNPDRKKWATFIKS